MLVSVTNLNINKKCFESCESYMIMRSPYAMSTPSIPWACKLCLPVVGIWGPFRMFPKCQSLPCGRLCHQCGSPAPLFYSFFKKAVPWVLIMFTSPTPTFPRYSLLWCFVFLPKSRSTWPKYSQMCGLPLDGGWLTRGYFLSQQLATSF